MSSGGNVRGRVAFWLAVASFVAAMLCAIESATGGDSIYRVLAALTFVLGLIFTAGVWAARLPQRTDPDDEWRTIR